MSDLLHTTIARMNGNSDIFKLAPRLHRIVASKVMDLYETVILFPCEFFYERIEGSVFPKQICAYNSFSACGEFPRKICSNCSILSKRRAFSPSLITAISAGYSIALLYFP